jgi:hypothetical protein
LVRYLVLRLGLEAAEDGVLVGEGVERHGCCSPRGAAGGSDRIRSRIDRRRRSGWGGEEADDDGERGRWEDPTRPDAAEYIANQTKPNPTQPRASCAGVLALAGTRRPWRERLPRSRLFGYQLLLFFLTKKNTTR